MPVGGADAIGPGIPAANHQHVLAVSADADVVWNRITSIALVLLRQEFHGEVHAIKVTTGNRQITREFCTAG